MTLGKRLRGFRATTACLVIAALALSPAAADAAAKKKAPAKKPTIAALKEAHGKKPAKKVAVKKPAAGVDGISDTFGLSPSMQLAAMNTGISASGAFFVGRMTGCKSITPMLASLPGQIMGGDFRDSDGYCYVWLNVRQSSMLTGSEICKTALHEVGHLTGLEHSTDPADVMFSPFQADPIPSVCQRKP